MKNKIYSFAAASLLAALPLTAAAQDITREAEKPAEAAAAQAKTEQTAQAAQAKAAEESAEVTYAQVLERPDDPALNLAYAKTQVRRGDLKGAAATLERMLMVAPDTHDIRLFYALVLFRLDNLAEAGRELDAVQKSPAPAALKAEAAKYSAEISRRRQLNTVSASLAAGFSYDSNRNAAPLSGKRLLSDTPLALTGLSKRRDDMSLMVMGGAELRRVLDQRTRNDVFLGLNYFRADQDSVKTVNLQAVSARLGGTYKYNRYSLKPALLYDNVTLHGARFLENTGLGLRAETPLDRRTSVSAELKYTYGEHHATPDVGANPERRGPLWSLSAGAGRALNPVMKLDADLTFSAKAADKSYNSYRDTALALRHSWLLGKGRFLLSSLALANSVYSRADAAISSKTRRDASLRLGATAGAPLAGLHPRLRRFENVTLTLTLEHFKSNSTVTNYTYENNKAALLAGYRWSLGF